ncbi:hypothetical protein F1654_00590 [Alkalicaulis satelles]|uniref:Uncharacterized protein n=1 Tax=Alkalicaulis satelles TaxID=2609175 RepID=A0A5M6ZI84_9PROT|nr:hypothetical protein [Alkalicaulis satelles]KAA5804542.1 hypothetical protein F1654_00590 [Alkalicaulis satelles]
MSELAAAIGVFLTACGLVFLLAPLMPAAGGVIGAARTRLEINGGFEAGAAMVTGVLFATCGVGLLIWSAGAL